MVGDTHVPDGFLPPAADAGATLLSACCTTRSTGSGATLAPPELAADCPWSRAMASPGPSRSRTATCGSWTAPRCALRDVVFSLVLARSPACTLGRDLCDAVAQHLETALRAGARPGRLDAHGALPAVPGGGPGSAADRVGGRRAGGGGAIIAAAADMDPAAPDAQVARIAEATNADACLSDSPPFGCRFADHSADARADAGRGRSPAAGAGHLDGRDGCRRRGGSRRGPARPRRGPGAGAQRRGDRRSPRRWR